MIKAFFSRQFLSLRLFLIIVFCFFSAVSIVLVNFRHDYLFEFELDLEQSLGDLTRLQDKIKADEYAVLQDYLLYRMATKKMKMVEVKKAIPLEKVLKKYGGKQ